MTPPQTQTVADVIVARYRELRTSGRLGRPQWLSAETITSRVSQRELQLLALAVVLTGGQIALAVVIYTQAAKIVAAPVHKPAPPALIEPPHRSLNLTGPPKIPVLFGSIVRQNETWECDSPVNVALVKVTITSAVGDDRRNADAVHMRAGCTGRIGRIEITQSAGDGIKVAEGVHDLTIYGGTIRCLAKSPTLHQDGIQVLGGERIRFDNLYVDCGRAEHGALVNSNLFIRQAGKSIDPPTDVVCDRCYLGGDAAHTVSVQESVRSGVTNSVLCPARYSRQMLAVGPEAVDPVTSGNRIGPCGGEKAGRKVRVLTRHRSNGQ